MTFSPNKVDSIHGIKMINNIDYRDDRGEISKIPNKVLKLFFICPLYFDLNQFLLCDQHLLLKNLQVSFHQYRLYFQ